MRDLDNAIIFQTLNEPLVTVGTLAAEYVPTTYFRLVVKCVGPDCGVTVPDVAVGASRSEVGRRPRFCV
jgi:hypothetical protein